jgi:hypothetical protein
MANKKTDSGLPPEQPKAPGNAKAGQPIRREEFGGDLLPWLDSSKARWTTGENRGHLRPAAASEDRGSGCVRPARRHEFDHPAGARASGAHIREGTERRVLKVLN